MRTDNPEDVWLVLAYQLPKGPGALRVKIWRRLQRLGAIAIKSSVYVLPLNAQAREDFQWTLAELKNGGGEGVILESRFVAGASAAEVRALFTAAREADYRELAAEIRARDSDRNSEPEEQFERTLSRMRRRLAQIDAIDAFGAPGREAVLDAMHQLMESKSTARGVEMAGGEFSELMQRTWVTRRDVHVDRIASAWLVHRWIDPAARFKFVDEEGYRHQEGEIRFDMFEGEFTHEGDLCTFEVLARHARPDDGALRRLSEIVHDIDLKDGKFGHAETDGVAMLLSGIIARSGDDHERIRRGADLFEDVYRSLTGIPDHRRPHV